MKAKELEREAKAASARGENRDAARLYREASLKHADSAVKWAYVAIGAASVSFALNVVAVVLR